MRSLLDVNVLVALLDKDHNAHEIVAEWFTTHVRKGWFSCPLTQNGCIRILSAPQYPQPLHITDAVEKLRQATSSKYHSFISDSISIINDDLIDSAYLLGHRQITDAYLLALAVSHDSRFVTLDSRIPLRIVKNANERSLIALPFREEARG